MNSYGMVLSINDGFNQQEQGFNQPTISTEHHGDIMGTYQQQIYDLDLSRNGAAKWQSSNGDNYAKLLDYGDAPFSDRPIVVGKSMGKSSPGRPTILLLKFIEFCSSGMRLNCLKSSVWNNGHWIPVEMVLSKEHQKTK